MSLDTASDSLRPIIADILRATPVLYPPDSSRVMWDEIDDQQHRRWLGADLLDYVEQRETIEIDDECHARSAELEAQADDYAEQLEAEHTQNAEHLKTIAALREEIKDWKASV